MWNHLAFLVLESLLHSLTFDLGGSLCVFSVFLD